MDARNTTKLRYILDIVSACVRDLINLVPGGAMSLLPFKLQLQSVFALTLLGIVVTTLPAQANALSEDDAEQVHALLTEASIKSHDFFSAYFGVSKGRDQIECILSLENVFHEAISSLKNTRNAVHVAASMETDADEAKANYGVSAALFDSINQMSIDYNLVKDIPKNCPGDDFLAQNARDVVAFIDRSRPLLKAIQKKIPEKDSLKPTKFGFYKDVP